MALKRSTLFYYSLTDLPVSMALFPVLVFIPKFYTSDMGVPLAVAGSVILAVRIFDVFTDPLFGIISDKTRTPWGRRRPWIALAVPIMMLSIYKLFMPPDGAGAMHMFVWMMLLSIATTIMIIPYYAWAAELSPDYNERSRITGWRSMMGVVGSLSAQLAPAAALLFFGIGGSGSVLQIVGVTMLILMPICVLLTVTRVPESKNYVSSARSAIVPGATAAQARAAAYTALSYAGIGSATVTITPAVLGPGDNEVTVDVSVPMDPNSYLTPLFLSGRNAREIEPQGLCLR